jgi:hypothetical protein
VPVPLTAPAQCDSAFITFPGVIALGGEPKWLGETPMNVQVFLTFRMKIMIIGCYFRIGTLLSISYDECRRTKKGRPRGGLVTIQKLPVCHA